jgi:5-bromo-4-chloroindolyl phosphate hydrolysis protein
MKKTLSDVEETLDSMHETYKKQLTSLFEDDILDLNTEISVLKKTIKLES